MIFKSRQNVYKVITAFAITTGTSLVLAIGVLLITDLYPTRPYTADSFVFPWVFGFLAVIFGLIAGTFQYNKIKEEAGIKIKVLSDEEEFENQVENYRNLGITKSNKGQATLFLGLVIIISLALSFFDAIPLRDVLYGSIIYVPLMFFIYKGHRWAMILGIFAWTIDKGAQLFYFSDGKGSFLVTIAFWLWLVSILYSAIKVENERKKRECIKNESENKQQYHSENNATEGKSFCSNCGNLVESEANFCRICGNKIIK